MPDSPRELFALYLEHADLVENAASAAASASAEMAKAEAAYQAARASLVSAAGDLSGSLADLSAVVDLARESGVPDLDQLRLLGPPPGASPLPSAPVAPPSKEEVSGREKRTSPGYSKYAVYHVLTPAFKTIARVTVLAELGRSTVGSALSDLCRAGLVRRQRNGLETEYALVDREPLPLGLPELASLGSLLRTEEGKAQLSALLASLRSARDQKEAVAEKRPPKPKAKIQAPPPLRASDESPDHPTVSVVPDPEPITRTSLLEARPLPPWQPGDHVRAYDSEMHQYQPGVVERIVARGTRRGDVLVRLSAGRTRRGGHGGARLIQVDADHVKRADTA